MNKEELHKMARDCGMKEGCSSFGPDWFVTNAMLEKLYNAILERAAVATENEPKTWDKDAPTPQVRAAAAIRALKL